MKGQRLQIKPHRSQAQTLMQWIGCQRFIYNAKVHDDRYFRAFARGSLQHAGQYAPVDQTYSQYKAQAPFLSDVPSQILRNGATRWYDAYQRFFNQLGGRPKIKTKHGRQSVLLTSELFTIKQNEQGNWFLHLGTKRRPLGAIRINTQKKELAALPKMVVVSVHAGRWWVSFSLPQTDHAGQPILYPAYTEVLAHLSTYSDEELAHAVNGVDRGVVQSACDSKGLITDKGLTSNNKQLARKEIKRQRYQRKMARQTKGSKRYARTKQKAARLTQYRAHCIQNTAHQISHRLASDTDTMVVALEDLRVQNMTKSAKGSAAKPGKQVRQKAGLNRSILQSGWGQLRTYLSYKLFQRGKLFVLVPPHYTSQECSRCGAIDKASRLSQAAFACKACGFTLNADSNAAQVIARHAAYALHQHLHSGQELSTRGSGKPKPQTPVELYVSHEVIQSFRAQGNEAGNPQPERAKAS